MSTAKQPGLSDSRASQDAEQTPKSGAVCIANISPAERRKRLAFGLLALALSLAILSS